jgi:hypothetical protein
MIELLPWQLPLADRIVEIFSRSDTAINAAGTGSGKTYLAVETAKRLSLPFLVIAPKATLTSWKRVAEGMGAATLFKGAINPERISLGRCPYYDGTAWHLDGIGMVVWDEVHRGCSGIDSKATLAAARLKRLPIKKMFMSATVADSPLKLRALGYVLGFHDFSKAGFMKWCCKYGVFLNRNLPRPCYAFTKSKTAAAKHMAEVHKLMADRMLRLKVSDIPGFPESQLEPKLIDLEEHDRAALAEAYSEMEDRMKGCGTIPLTEMLRARERAEYVKASFMAESAADLVEEGTSVVVFANFRSALKRIKEKLGEYEVGEIGEIHGDQTPDERQGWIDKFQANKCHVILVMTAAGGTGLSLHDDKKERPRASLITPGVSASEFRQALGRIHRVGGTPVVQTIVLASGTIEERVYEAIQRKTTGIDSVNGVNLLTDSDLIGTT